MDAKKAASNKNSWAGGKKTRILIVDDHPMVRAGLALVIGGESDFELCGEAAGAIEAMRLAQQSKPDLMVVDISLEEGSGIDLIKQLRAVDENVKVLVSSMHDENLFAERALQAGASGFISKKEGGEKVVEAIRLVLKGKVYLSEQMSERLLAALAHNPNRALSALEALSTRELEVFQSIGEGLSTKETAHKLHLSVKTVETHQGRIKSKLGLRDHTDLIRHAMQFVSESGKREA